MDSPDEGNQINRTTKEQSYIENEIIKVYDKYREFCLHEEETEENLPEEEFKKLTTHYLAQDLHCHFLYSSLRNCGGWGKHFYNGQPWMIYWMCNALGVLGNDFWTYEKDGLPEKAVAYISRCQHPDGGFTGGPYQIGHLASSYAAMLTLVLMGLEEGYKVVDRQKMYNFLMRMRNPNIKGSFLVHEKGECDMRGTYIAMVIADILNIMTDELKENVGDYIASLQTYEGGIAAAPLEEAHGGYTFCGFAGLTILQEQHKVDLGKLLYWATNRQLSTEGGFNGRTNKVVDACYTFWVGALFPLLNMATGNALHNEGKQLYDQMKLQQYVLVCGQDREFGGLRDKPGKNSDFYHTCYAASGLALSQTLVGRDEKLLFKNIEENKVKIVDPVFNVDPKKLAKAKEWFKNQPPIEPLSKKI